MAASVIRRSSQEKMNTNYLYGPLNPLNTLVLKYFLFYLDDSKLTHRTFSEWAH